MVAFVFWSKNYRPFLERGLLERLQQADYNCLFQYTITGLPRIFETDLVDVGDAIDSFKTLSGRLSPEHVAWRYDPTLLSDQTDAEYHLQRFRYIAEALAGFTKRCYFSFAIQYGKVERNFRKFSAEHSVDFRDPGTETKIELTNRLADIAAEFGIEMQTCCGDYLISDKIKKAHCVDGDLISRLFFNGTWNGKSRPTRKECGCAESTDIGKYDTCPHGCIYCYANLHKDKALEMYNAHDANSAFLGYSKAESDRFVAELEAMKAAKGNTEKKRQMNLMGF